MGARNGSIGLHCWVSTFLTPYEVFSLCNYPLEQIVILYLKKRSKNAPFTGRTAHRGSRGIALLFHDHGTGRGWGISVTPQPLFTPSKDPVPIVQEAGWAPGPVWTGAENPVPTGIRSPDRPARSQPLYRLSYPAHVILRTWVQM